MNTFQNLSKTKQDRITQAAMKEFGEKGYSRASINAMVESLKIAKGSIFQYFGDKKGLFLFIFETCTEQVKRYLRTVRDQTSDKNLFERLESTLLAGVNFLNEHPLIYRLYIKTLFEHDVPFREEILLTLRRESMSYLRGFLETAAQRGELRQGVDIDIACFILDAVMDRFLQAQTIPHLDAGIGLYKCDMQRSKIWITHLIEILHLGIGNGNNSSAL